MKRKIGDMKVTSFHQRRQKIGKRKEKKETKQIRNLSVSIYFTRFMLVIKSCSPFSSM